MSYYEGGSQWSSPGQNNWDHQAPTPTRTGATGPTATDDYAFFYQFDEVDRAFENVSKSGKAYAMGGVRREYSRRSPALRSPGHPRSSMTDGRSSHGSGPRGHAMNDFGESRGHQSNLQNFYSSQRHQSSRGSNEVEHVMQAKRRMAAQRERELRNLHTEQQYQRNVLADVTYNNKMMSEEETRELIARQRNALYGEGPFTEKGGYIDETGNVRPGLPGHSGPASLRGHSPLNYEMGRNAPPNDGSASVSAADLIQASQHSVQDTGPRANSASSPQPNPTGNKSVFDASVGQSGNRTSNSSPGGSPPRQEMPASSKPGLTGTTVAPIGTRPSGTPATTTAAAKRSTTPLASPGGWGRGNGVWGQSSGLGAQASVWG